MAAANRDWEGGMGRWGEEEVQDHTSVRGSNRGRKDLGYPPPPPPPRIFITKFQHYSRMFCAYATYFRMAISTSRMPQNQSQSFKNFPGGGGGGMPPDPPSGGVLKHTLHVNAKLWSFPPQTPNPV